jgi:small subunit ribosomal protein S20
LSAKKAARQQVKRSHRNRGVRSATRNGVATALRSMSGGEVSASETSVAHALSLLDQAVRKGVMPKNTASRSKSRLSVRLNLMKGSSSS